MRSIQMVSLACIAAYSGAANAADAAQPDPHGTGVVYFVVENGAGGLWQRRATNPAQDRLRYLNGAFCQERQGCSRADATFAARADYAERDYIDALSLGSYGPMNLKFTGDRVKLKVRF